MSHPRSHRETFPFLDLPEDLQEIVWQKHYAGIMRDTVLPAVAGVVRETHARRLRITRQYLQHLYEFHFDAVGREPQPIDVRAMRARMLYHEAVSTGGDDSHAACWRQWQTTDDKRLGVERNVLPFLSHDLFALLASGDVDSFGTFELLISASVLSSTLFLGAAQEEE